ncbi:helix-turn-helix transcriptional regulator [Treponema sp. OMZ 305]|jgi:Helix-turn-helix.|uniref:helix-turn-helix domain-containing protein n=1 Tax=Treponema TaxID=157 RepID=UPI001BB071BA|nr:MULTISPECIES: helix-turn-helix transcriptional regulator [Treponema]QUY17490.1 helix-turn-helix transcriptional regulator [Treponema vincentii]UTC57352.1 helix-turn-helix transcriptional regulator [Treponema sp. OMZ 305]
MTQIELRGYLSQNIKTYRKRLALTQEKLAEKTGLSTQTINDIEGCRTWVSDKSLIKIAEILHTTPAVLLFPKQESARTTFSENDIEIAKIKAELTAAINAQIQEVFLPYQK